MAISSDLEHLLVRWLPRQRWMPGLGTSAGSEPDVTPQSVVRIAEVSDEQAGTVQCLLVVLAVRGPARRTRLCVPLTVRTEEDFSLRPHLIGTVDDLLLGRTFVYDGAADPVFVLALADAIRDARSSASEGFVSQLAGDELPAIPPEAAPAPEAAAPAATVDSDAAASDVPADEVAEAASITEAEPTATAALLERAAQHTFRREEGLTGESRVEIEGPDGSFALTVLREVGAENPPAVRYPLALTARDSDTIHPVIGWSRTRWYDDADLTTVVAPFAVLAHALPGSRRAWRSAVEKAIDVDSGSVGSFSRQASVLGSTAGRLHTELASEFGTVRSEGDPTRRLVEKWRTRIEWALRSAPAALSPHADRLREHGEALAELAGLGLLQRIHGELTLDHLTVGTAEGPRAIGFGVGRDEPRPAEIDLVALVRSVDYAAGYAWLQRHADSEDAQESLRGLATTGLEAQLRANYLGSPEHLWYRRTVNSLLSGYSHARGTTANLTDPVLRAALIDRLLVETVTELRNRPAWLILPLAALAETLGESESQDAETDDPVDPDAEPSSGHAEVGAGVAEAAAGDGSDDSAATISETDDGLDPGTGDGTVDRTDDGSDTADDGSDSAEERDSDVGSLQVDPDEDSDDARIAPGADVMPRGARFDDDRLHRAPVFVEEQSAAESAGEEAADAEHADAEPTAAEPEVAEAEAEPEQGEPEFVVAPAAELPDAEAEVDDHADADEVATEVGNIRPQPEPEPVPDPESEPEPEPMPEPELDPEVPPRPAHGPSFGPDSGVASEDSEVAIDTTADAADLDEDGAGAEEADADVHPRSARDSR